MGKETRIGMGVVGVLLAISMAVLYGRLTRDSGPRIDVNIGAEQEDLQGETGNIVPRQPTIRRNNNTFQPKVSPVPRTTPEEKPRTNQSFLPDPDGSPTAKANHNLAIPDYDSSPRYASPFTSPVSSQEQRSQSGQSPASSTDRASDSIRAAQRPGA